MRRCPPGSFGEACDLNRSFIYREHDPYQSFSPLEAAKLEGFSPEYEFHEPLVLKRSAALVHTEFRTEWAERLSAFAPHHPCAVGGAMGWPNDAVRNVPRTLWVAHHNHVACAVGGSDRAQKTAAILLAGLRDAAVRRPSERLANFEAVRIGVGDVHCNEVTLAFATFWREGVDRPCHARLLPSWIFADAREPGMHPNFTTISQQLAAAAVSRASNGAASLEASLDGATRCGWIGSSISDIHPDSRNPPGLYRPLRQQFVSVAAAHSDAIEAIDCSGAIPKAQQTVAKGSKQQGDAVTKHPGRGLSSAPATPMPCSLSMQSQAKRWRCMVDVKGAGFSVRVPILLFSGRPLLFVERPGLRTFHEAESFPRPWRAWAHYVPVAANMSDLVERARWLLSHPVEADEIGRRALRYADCFLTAEFARSYATQQLLAAGACSTQCATTQHRCSSCMLGGTLQRAAKSFAWVLDAAPKGTLSPPQGGATSSNGRQRELLQPCRSV